MALQDDLMLRLKPLWTMSAPAPSDILHRSEFLSLKEFFHDRFAAADKGLGFPFGLWDVLRSLGMPAALPANSPEHLLGEMGSAAVALIDAMQATTSVHRYLCPLDMADDFPNMQFGQTRIFIPDRHELEALLGTRRLSRHYPGENVDLARLSRFHWMVIEEAVPLPPRVGERAFPFLYQNWRRDLGAITPHADQYAPAVSKALGMLLLAPWEDWHNYAEMDWRGFQIPWVHIESDDLFLKPRRVPSADLLTWEPASYEDDFGEQIEYERPVVAHLHGDAHEALTTFNDELWDRLEVARASPLFETPVEHFMVRAYFSGGMDEIIAHMTAIEAGLGSRDDYRNANKSGQKMSVTKRMSQRVAHLLSDPEAGTQYESLFDLRSAYLHGRAMREPVSSANRNLARALARRVMSSLIDAANAIPAPTNRDEFLVQLA